MMKLGSCTPLRGAIIIPSYAKESRISCPTKHI